MLLLVLEIAIRRAREFAHSLSWRPGTSQNGTKLWRMDRFSVQMRRVTDAIHRQTLLFALHFPLMLRKANEIDRHGIGRLRMEKWPSATLGSCSAQWERRTKKKIYCDASGSIVLYFGFNVWTKKISHKKPLFPSANSASGGMPSIGAGFC